MSPSYCPNYQLKSGRFSKNQRVVSTCNIIPTQIKEEEEEEGKGKIKVMSDARVPAIMLTVILTVILIVILTRVRTRNLAPLPFPLPLPLALAPPLPLFLLRGGERGGEGTGTVGIIKVTVLPLNIWQEALGLQASL